MMIVAKSTEFIVKEFCERLSPGQESLILDIQAGSDAMQGQAKENVEAKIKSDGGTSLEGWTIWYEEDVIVEGEAHMIWVSPSGEKIDITPREGHEKVMFLPQEGVWSKEPPIANKRQALADTLIVRAVYRMSEWRDKLKAQYGNEEAIPEAEMEKVNRAYNRVASNSIRNWEPCPFHPGKQFGKCCGKVKGKPLTNF